jgi:hypothetical protein
VVDIDRIPDWVRVVGHAVSNRRGPGLPVAHLDLDTLVVRPGPAGDLRILRFIAGERSITVTVHRGEAGVSMSIVLSPPKRVWMEVRPLRGVAQTVSSDDTGVALCESIHAGPLSLLVHWADHEGGPTRTEWVQV